MGLAVEQVLAGPIVRRVETNRVAVWVALRAAVSKLPLTIYIKGHGVHGTVLDHATCVPTQLDNELWVALPTVNLADGERLQAGTVYEYDLSFDQVTLFTLGLLQNIGIVQFDRGTAPADPLVVQHSLYAWDRTVVGQRGTADFASPWPTSRAAAQIYAQYRGSLDTADQLARDRPEPA